MNLLMILTLTVFIVDAVVNFGTHLAHIHSILLETCFDASLMAALLFPVLYIGVFKEMVSKNAELTASKARLAAAHDELELRIAERTKDLATANKTLEQSIATSDAHRAVAVQLADTVRLLQACHSSAEAYAIIAKKFQKLLPGVSGALYVFKSSRNILDRVIEWNAPEEFFSAFFRPDECWALRMGKIHKMSSSDISIRCQHFAADACSAICLPLVASGEVLGGLSFRLDRQAAQNGTETCLDNGETESQQEFIYLSLMSESVGIALANIRLREALHEHAIIDKLTGLFNRRFMDEVMDMEISQADRNKTPLAVVMLDVDHFKKFNDLHGHDAGDVVLSALGRCFVQHARKSDIVCRYGGEEILILLPNTDTADAVRWADAVREKVEGMTLNHHGQQLGPVTVSCGVASYPTNARNKRELIKAADEALYHSKAEGRNRVNAATGFEVIKFNGQAAAPELRKA